MHDGQKCLIPGDNTHNNQNGRESGIAFVCQTGLIKHSAVTAVFDQLSISGTYCRLLHGTSKTNIVCHLGNPTPLVAPNHLIVPSLKNGIRTQTANLIMRTHAKLSLLPSRAKIMAAWVADLWVRLVFHDNPVQPNGFLSGRSDCTIVEPLTHQPSGCQGYRGIASLSGLEIHGSPQKSHGGINSTPTILQHQL